MTKMFTSKDLAVQERMWRPKKFGRKTFQTRMLMYDTGDGEYLVILFFFKKHPLDVVEVWHCAAIRDEREGKGFISKFTVSTKQMMEGRLAENMYEEKLERGYTRFSARTLRDFFGTVIRVRYRFGHRRSLRHR